MFVYVNWINETLELTTLITANGRVVLDERRKIDVHKKRWTLDAWTLDAWTLDTGVLGLWTVRLLTLTLWTLWPRKLFPFLVTSISFLLLFNVEFLSLWRQKGFRKCSSEDFLICFSKSKIIQTDFCLISMILAVQEIIFGSPVTQSS